MIRTFLALLGAMFVFVAEPAMAQQRAPLDWFLGYDQFRSASMSPSGRYLAVLRHDEIGDVLMIVDMETRQSRAIQRARTDQSLQISAVGFASDSRLVFILQQRNRVEFTRGTMVRRAVDGGFETNSRIYSCNLDGTGLVALYDPTRQGFDAYVDAGLVSTLPHDDDNVLLIVPTQGGAELRKVNVNTAEATRVDRGTLFTFNWVVDIDGTPVLRQDDVGNGRGYAWLRRGPGQRNWTEITRYRGAEGVNSAPPFAPIGAAGAAGQVLVAARRDGSNTRGLYVYDSATGEYAQTVEVNQGFDIDDGAIDPERGVVVAACWWEQRYTCESKDAAFAERWTAATQALGSNVNTLLVDQSDDLNRMLLLTYGPQDLGTYYLYNHTTHALNVVFRQRPEATNAALLPTERIVEYTTSDGQHEWGYLWLPPGVSNAHNLPTIVVPHGGPEGRDYFGSDAFANAYASQGYAVFQPNFRGGDGFGRAFVEAGHHQWGQRMQADVADGTRYLIEQGIADPNRICINGWSYGGYVAFTASFMNTDLFKCSVAGAGVSDLRAMLRWVRSGSTENDVSNGGGGGQQSPSYQYWTDAIGDPGRDDATLDQYSAAENVDRVTIPLLMIHGDEDTTVPIEQSQIMQRAMQHAGKDARLIVLPNVDHQATPIQGDAWRTVLTESLAFFNENIGPGVAPGSQ